MVFRNREESIDVQEKRTWRLASNVRVFFAFALMFFLTVVTLIAFQIARGEGREGAWFFVLWVLFALSSLAFAAFRGITSITIEGNVVELRSLLSRRRIAPEDIVSVETSWWDMNRFSPRIRTRTGSFGLLGPFDGFHELLTTLKELNPSIEIKRL